MGAKPSVTLKGASAFMDMFKSTDPDRDKSSNTLPLSCLIPSELHPFKPYNEEKKQAMVESIRQNGVLEPLLVRPIGDDRYEIIAGHNRAECAESAGLSDVPAVIMELDDDQAVLVMVESNLCQRESILPSERAFAFKLQLEALNRQGARAEASSDQNGPKLSAQIVAEKGDTSMTQVKRYIRLTFLIPELLDMVDNSKLPFTYAVDLSYLKQSHQTLVLELMQDKAYKLTSAVCARLKEKAKDLTNDAINKIMLAKPPMPKKEVKIPLKTISKYNIPQNKVQEVIVKALDLYFAAQQEV